MGIHRPLLVLSAFHLPQMNKATTHLAITRSSCSSPSSEAPSFAGHYNPIRLQVTRHNNNDAGWSCERGPVRTSFLLGHQLINAHEWAKSHISPLCLGIPSLLGRRSSAHFFSCSRHTHNPTQSSTRCKNRRILLLPQGPNGSNQTTNRRLYKSLSNSTQDCSIHPMDSVIKEDTTKAASKNQQMLWNQWQLLDSILPTGGFAHSYGLEAAMQSRMVNNPENLRSFVIQVLENTGSLLLPFVYCASKSPDATTWVKLDQLLEATLTNEVGRKASMSQGSALLRVSASVFTEIPTLQELRQTFLGSKSVSFHHAPLFGLICRLIGFDSETTQRAYMFVTMRDVISAATRLNLVGPLAASTLQHQVALDAERMVQKWSDRDVAEASQTAPLLDALQGCHAYMFSRLFCS